jgi:hypothetical protein
VYEEIPAVVAECLAAGFPPKEIQVKNDMLNLLLRPLADELGFKIKKQSRLRVIERVRRELQKFTRRHRI